MSFFMLQQAYKDKPVNDWTTKDFMSFINDLGIKGKPYNSIKVAMYETGLSAKHIKPNADDIKEAFGISNLLAKRICAELKQFNVTYCVKRVTTQSLPTSPFAEEDDFQVSVRHKQGTMALLRTSFTKDSTIGDVAHSYKEQECAQISSETDFYLTARRKVLQHDKTLAHYGIVNSNNLITVIFKTKGGAMATNNDTDRCIKFKKYGLRQTSLPDVLIGYDDSDGIDRALLECGKHAMSAETMFQYITSSLASNLNQTEIMCPDNGCGKVLDWEICTQIADMNTAEYMKWTDVIEKRAMVNCKRCPYCEAYCLRDDGVAIFRMHCIACNGGDWCWECCQPWKGSGNSMCCNQNCNLIFYSNTKLRTCPMVKVSDTNVEMPQFRACPRCLTFIEYTEFCRHMECSGCGKEFCFVCLKLQDSEGNWPCGSLDTFCKMAPRQQFK
eukprot:686058_1